MVDDTLLNNCSIIEHCIKRFGQDYGGFEDQIESDFRQLVKWSIHLTQQ